MKALERDSNCLRPHGAYIEDWRDSQGSIWQYVMPVSMTVSRALLSSAFMVQEKEKYITDFRNRENDYLSWLQVSNKDFVIYHIVDDKVFAITNRDGKLYVISGNLRRVEMYAGKKSPIFDTERRLFIAINKFQYDMDDPYLHLRCIY